MATPPGPGLAHAALLYDSDDQFLDTAIPFLRQGLDDGEPTVLCVGGPQRQLVLDELGVAMGLTEIPAWSSSAPFATLRDNQQLINEQVNGGATHVRILGEVPFREDPVMWGGWIRYETAVNELFADLAVSMLCAYDRRSAGPDVLGDVVGSHPALCPDGDGQRNPRFVPPVRFLADLAARDVDPIEGGPPAVVLYDPRAAVSRGAVASLATAADFDPVTIEALVLAVGEVVTNAIVSGQPPVVVRAWAPPGRIVVAVEDHGPGPDDPFVGMLPLASAPNGGLGLHLVYQLCTLVTFSRGSPGFTVHLTMHRPTHDRQG
ncbi:MAG TPA: sensor histidine kinase [Desertimonas sp.]|nr:sensor histidine kinase [Desertimonas sp.]